MRHSCRSAPHLGQSGRVPAGVDDPFLHDVQISVENLDSVGLRRLAKKPSWQPNVRVGPDNWTLLHLAIDAELDFSHQFGEPLTADMTQLLLKLGTDPRLQAANGETPREMASRGEHGPAVELLKRYEA